MFPSVRASRLHLPGSLCSTPVTVLRRSYGPSDSCPGGSSALLSMNTGLYPNGQVSLRHAHPRVDHSVSNHLTSLALASTTLPLSGTSAPRTRGRASSFPRRL